MSSEPLRRLSIARGSDVGGIHCSATPCGTTSRSRNSRSAPRSGRLAAPTISGATTKPPTRSGAAAAPVVASKQTR
jgi:hypothetical protein